MAHVDGVETRGLSRAILSGVNGANKVKCTTDCGVTFSVRHGGVNDVAI